MITLKFIKAVASGNDFVIVDARSSTAVKVPKGETLTWPAIARRMCGRKVGVGADGLLLLEASSTADVAMRIFNPDGSEVTMCGNGARCVAFYCGGRSRIETAAGMVHGQVQGGGRVKIKMTDPHGLKLRLPIDIDGKRLEVHRINTGVPHVVCLADDLDHVNVTKVGRALRYHGDFQPEGTNADFVKIVDKGAIAVRTYERGVEDETLACGTGACASAVVSSLLAGTKAPVAVHTRSGEVLKIYFDREHDVIKNVYLEGEVRIVYEGKAVLDD